MKSTITLRNVYGGDPPNPPLKMERITFSGGEPHIVCDPSEVSGAYLWLDARIHSGNDLLELAVAVDVIRRMKPARLGLHCPYILGGRQDRPFTNGPFTLKVIASILNSLDLDVIVTCDPHSDVTFALLNNCFVIPQSKIIEQEVGIHHDYSGLISVDAGSLKKIYDVAASLGITNVIQAGKHRDVKTGKLSGFTCQPFSRGRGRFLIADDVIDGGGTFVGLAQHIMAEWRNWGNVTDPPELTLFATHGIFSRGLDDLLTYFRRIITTDSFPQGDRVTTIPLSGLAAGYMRSLIGQ